MSDQQSESTKNGNHSSDDEGNGMGRQAEPGARARRYGRQKALADLERQPESPATSASEGLKELTVEGEPTDNGNNSHPDEREHEKEKQISTGIDAGSNSKNRTENGVENGTTNSNNEKRGPGAMRKGRRVRDTAAMYDIVDTRDNHEKIGSGGRGVNLISNFFDIKRDMNWSLHHYHVEFTPEVEHFGTRRALLRNHSKLLPAYIFDGVALHTSKQLDEDVTNFESETREKQTVQIKIKLVAKLEKSDSMYIQFYNILIRKCLQLLGLALLGRNFYDSEMCIPLPNHRIQIWPGFLTTMRIHDRGLLYGVDVINKVLRMDNTFQMMVAKRSELMQRGASKERIQEAVREELVGCIVITHYNKKTYRIDDISFNESAKSTFLKKGVAISYADYYRDRHNITIEQQNQPLLISNPKKADMHRGQTEPVKLIPELCYMTGLSNEMRQNFNLMRDMGQYLFQPPEPKRGLVEQFAKRLRSSPAIQAELDQWGLKVNTKMISLQARQMAPEQVGFNEQRRDDMKLIPAQNGDFTTAFRSTRLISCVPLKLWVFIVPQRDSQHAGNLVNTMQKVSHPLGFEISQPVEIIKLQNPSVESYMAKINSSMDTYRNDLQMIFSILPNNKLDLYAAIKKRCYVDYGMPSQCMVARNMQSKGLMSIATKLTVQMNCKLGGEPWHLNIPLTNVMIVGFDLYRSGTGNKGTGIAAMVATVSDKFGKYYSSVSVLGSREEVATKVGSELMKCLKAWRRCNNDTLPERIIFYRDGVGEGQLQFVHTEELAGIKLHLKNTYKEAGYPLPKFTFIVVTKRINVRFFQEIPGRPVQNPGPGTVIDQEVTFPERYDFYLVAHSVRQGTVSPTSYNVIFDKSGLDADKIQKLTYKLCHLYYNFSGSVAVPAPCQYAKKLATLTGMATKAMNHPKLSNYLYFL